MQEVPRETDPRERSLDQSRDGARAARTEERECVEQVVEACVLGGWTVTDAMNAVEMARLREARHGEQARSVDISL